jgi:hypothetical protein
MHRFSDSLVDGTGLLRVGALSSALAKGPSRAHQLGHRLKTDGHRAL